MKGQVSSISTGSNLAVFRALGASPTTGAITCNFSVTSTGYIWQIYDISGVDTSGTNGSGAVVQSVAATASGSIPTATLATFSSSSNGTVGFIYEAGSGGAISAASGFTLIAGPNTTNVGEWRTTNSTAVTFTEASPRFLGRSSSALKLPFLVPRQPSRGDVVGGGAMMARNNIVLKIAMILSCLCLTNFSWIYGNGGYVGKTYYMSSSGSDGNNGTSPASPWATPNHALNCGDIISAAAGAYASGNFANTKWGTVSNCPNAQGVYFAQLICATAFACTINDSSLAGMRVDQSNWAIQGWVATSSVGTCFAATPSTAANIHHIAFVNDIANGCQNSAFQFSPYFANETFGVDQSAVVGVIAYNGAQGGSECFSGVSIYEPNNVDTSAGTHVFLAGIFSISNLDPIGGCPGNSDGEGVIFDDWSNSQSSTPAYTSQGALEQSMMLGNGSAGVQVFSTTSALIFVKSTTTYGDYQSTNHAGTYNGEGLISSAKQSTWTGNIFQASLATQNGNAVFGFLVGTGAIQSDATNTVSGNYIFGVGGNNTSNQGTGFSFGSNTLATPNFVSTTIPGAPSCSGQGNVPTCMATVIANFTPQAAGAIGLGYQPPAACTPDALYPVWLKGIIPNGIITKPCGM